MNKAQDIKNSLLHLACSERALANTRFFKTGKGEYGEGDVFMGVTVPQVRRVVKEVSTDITLTEVQKLLHDPVHEVRLCALLILVKLFQRTKTQEDKKRIFDFYIQNTPYINNWDLVDSSAHIIVGEYVFRYMHRAEQIAFMDRYIASKSLWENRMIVLATLHQIRQGNEESIFYVTKRMYMHPHDLIHKAIGWMLREVGKKCGDMVLCTFLDVHIHHLPRTVVRYAIERLPEQKRKMYLLKKKVT